MSDGINAHFSKAPEDNPEFVTRLGLAALMQWNNLPEEARYKLREQAIFVEFAGLPTHSQLAQQLDLFIKKWAGEGLR